MYMNLDEVNTKTAKMTVAGNENLTRDQAQELAIQFCNLVNAQVTQIDVVKECRQRTYVSDLLLDGQP